MSILDIGTKMNKMQSIETNIIFMIELSNVGKDGIRLSREKGKVRIVD